LDSFGRAWATVEAAGLRIVAARTTRLSSDEAVAVSALLADGACVGDASVLALQVIGANAGETLASAFALAAEDLRLPASTFVRAAPAHEGALGALFFGPQRLPSTRPRARDFSASACAVVLPHVLLAGAAGNLLSDFCAAVRTSNDAVAPLRVAALKIMDLSRAQAEEFLEVYKDVVPEYPVRWRRPARAIYGRARAQHFALPPPTPRAAGYGERVLERAARRNRSPGRRLCDSCPRYRGAPGC
jgi:hypothetical protein